MGSACASVYLSPQVWLAIMMPGMWVSRWVTRSYLFLQLWEGSGCHPPHRIIDCFTN